MRRRPRSSTESLFQRRFVGMSVLQGAGMLAIRWRFSRWLTRAGRVKPTRGRLRLPRWC